MQFQNFRTFFFWLKTSTFGTFIHAVLFKWYMIIIIPAVMAGYYFLKGLEKAGILQKFEDHLTSYLATLVNISEHCTPLILNIYEFYDCLGRY